MRRVVVTGMAGVTSLGDEWAVLREAFMGGASGVKRMPEWERLTDLSTKLGAPADWFQHEGQYKRQQMRSMGRVSVMAVKSAERALAQAGLADDPALKSSRAGVAAGSSFGSTPPIHDFVKFLDTGKAGALNATSYIRMMGHTIPVNLAVFFGLQGRVHTTSSACTSASQGIGYGFEAIRAGAADIMITGGAEEFCPTMTMVFDRLYATSNSNDSPQTAVKPFDAKRDGLVIGEGGAVLVLEELEHALARGARPLAEVAGYATNCDGTHISQPNEETQARVMQEALVSAGIHASDLAFVSAHGTATTAGDISEGRASAKIYGAKIPFHTLKGHLGHTLGPCGAIEAWLGIEMLNEQRVCATANLAEPDPKCGELDHVMGGPRKVSGDFFASNNFAFGGINTSLVFGRV